MRLIPQAHAASICDYWQFCKLGGVNDGEGTFGGLISVFLPRVLLIAGIIFFILVVIAGFGMVTSAGGDANAKEQSRAYMTYAVTGLIIIFASYWVLQIISYVTGGSLSGLFGP